MFNATIIEVALTLSLTYFLLSVICAALIELLSSWLSWRATILYDSLRQMLGDALTDNLYGHPLIVSLCRITQSEKLWESLFGRVKPRRPGYIPPRFFAIALLDEIITFRLSEQEWAKQNALNLRKLLRDNYGALVKIPFRPCGAARRRVRGKIVW
jgi:hypothetical protein